jgi:quercetin dioxygenase-like cupin family protein
MIVKKADDVPARPADMEGARDVSMALLIHDADGAPNFYMRQFTVAPGGHTPMHTHDWEHEVYVLAGSGQAVRGDEPNAIAAGDCVFVPPGEMHQFVNTAQVEMKFLCLVPKQ